MPVAQETGGTSSHMMKNAESRQDTSAAWPAEGYGINNVHLQHDVDMSGGREGHHLGRSTAAALSQGCMEAGECSQDGQVITLCGRTALAQSLVGSICLCPPVWRRLEHRPAMRQSCCDGQRGGTAPA